MKAKATREPQDRLTRMACRLQEQLHADPEYAEGDMAWFLLSDAKQGGICMDGYDRPAEAIADLLMHTEAILSTQGITMQVIQPQYN